MLLACSLAPARGCGSRFAIEINNATVVIGGPLMLWPRYTHKHSPELGRGRRENMLSSALRPGKLEWELARRVESRR